jgi:aminoglycoside/choline kinase family phosphotransferase
MIHPEIPLADARADTRLRFATDALGTRELTLTSASADAGFRSYWRATTNAGSWIVMDAPPALIECAPFLRIADLLREHGLNVPTVFASDIEQGFLLLSDLGTSTYLDAIHAGADPVPLMHAAIDALVRLQGIAVPDWLPPYDTALLERELDLFPEWYLGRQLGIDMSANETDDWHEARALLIASALEQPRVFVHRDYMPRNLMPADSAPGILDFQDAVVGPIGYDPIALLKDAFHSWPARNVESWLRRYHAQASAVGRPVQDWPEFRRASEWNGIQRHLKIIGLFARLQHRDGKAKYLADVPRFFTYILDVLPAYAELAGLQRLLRRYAPEGAGAP